MYIVLPQNWARGTRDLAKFTPGLMWRPARKAAYLNAIDELQAYFDSHYHPEVVIDGKQVLRRN